MTVAEALRRAADQLREADVVGGKRDARKLLRHALKQNGPVLDTHYILTEDQLSTYRAMISQRCVHQPVAQIIGKREFWGRDFIVTGDTLDPRPDSELIIEEALKLHPPKYILDLGAGTGCLLLTLLCEFQNAVGTAIDKSLSALNVARHNASALGVTERVTFLESDWFENVTGQFELIVCNPPYISEEEMGHLKLDVLDWEPHEALSPGGDGLASYRVLSAKIRSFLVPGGTAIFEMGATQGKAVRAIFEEAGFTDIKILRDLNAKERGIAIQRIE